MNKPKIVVVIPTVRPEQYKSFVGSWKSLFEKHEVTLVTVWDGETPRVDIWNYRKDGPIETDYNQTLYSTYKNLIYRYTDACRNLGFIVTAQLSPDYVLTLDDDVVPWKGDDLSIATVADVRTLCPDPIQAHLDVLQRKATLSWMNTAHDTDLYLRGVPYGIRDEAPVMLSHGVWVGTPDFDGETQLQLESCMGKYTNGVPYSLPYYVGPIPKGVLFPLCGMNVMVRREALPYFYFAPMGVDTKIEGLNRFGDIWMGVHLKREFDRLNWACYTGRSTILHTRASDAKKNFEQEKLGREWTEHLTRYIDCDFGWRKGLPDGFHDYMTMYRDKREQYKVLIDSLLVGDKNRV